MQWVRKNKKYLILIGGVLIFAALASFSSDKPDGLETVLQHHSFVEKVLVSIFPDYQVFAGNYPFLNNLLALLIGVGSVWLLIRVLFRSDKSTDA